MPHRRQQSVFMQWVIANIERVVAAVKDRAFAIEQFREEALLSKRQTGISRSVAVIRTVESDRDTFGPVRYQTSSETGVWLTYLDMGRRMACTFPGLPLFSLCRNSFS